MTKIHVHWIGLDPTYLNQANRAFGQGSRYAIRRVYNHPDMIHMVFEVVSPDPYKTLDLNVNSLASPLRRYGKKPPGLHPTGMSLSSFEKIYGPVDAPRLEE